jgi:hypothetical protein
MKKIIAVLVFVSVAAGIVFAQADGMLDLKRYFSYFPLREREDITDNDYVWIATENDYDKFALLAVRDYEIDTPLEFALLSYYSQPVLNIRPAEANVILPANNPKLADQKLGAAVFQEIQILRFLGDTAAVGRHEAVLSFITGRGNATRQEIEAFYRNNVGGLIAGVVDEEFRKWNTPIPSGTVTDIKQKITTFFIQPNQNTYQVLKDTRELMYLRSWILYHERMVAAGGIFGAQTVNDSRAELQRLRTQYGNIATTLNGINNSSVDTGDWDNGWRAFMGSIKELEERLVDRSGNFVR